LIVTVLLIIGVQLIFMCVIPVVCVTNKKGGVVVLFDYTTLLIRCPVTINYKR